MRVVALISWIVTALAGATLFSIWLSRGGLRRQGGREPVPPALILGHPILAVTGLILWIVYLASDTDGLRWVAFAILVVVATLGFTMARLWRQERAARVAAAGADRADLPPEQHFPVALIGLHGLLASSPWSWSCSPPSGSATSARHAASTGPSGPDLAAVAPRRRGWAGGAVAGPGHPPRRPRSARPGRGHRGWPDPVASGDGVFGAVFLSLVFGDFLVWTMWAAMNNLRHGEESEDVTLPAVLAVLSLSGLIACWAVIVRRRQPQAGGLAVALTPAGDLCRRHVLASRLLPGSPETQRRGTVVAIESANAAFSTASTGRTQRPGDSGRTATRPRHYQPDQVDGEPSPRPRLTRVDARGDLAGAPATAVGQGRCHAQAGPSSFLA